MLSEAAREKILKTIERYPLLSDLEGRMTQAVDILVGSVRKGGKILVCGNGGSAADSLHIVGELMKGFTLEREMPASLRERLQERFPDDAAYYADNLQGAIPAIALVNEVSLITAYGNDKCAELAFSQQVLGYGRAGDILLAISTSGNSTNVVHAAKIASALGMKVLALTGAGGGELAALSDILIAVPATAAYRVQELHLPVYHAICLAMEAELF